MNGGPDGVRTRDHRIKSPTLYLTELQAQNSNLGFLPDFATVLIPCATETLPCFVEVSIGFTTFWAMKILLLAPGCTIW